MLKEGLLWFDDDPRRAITAKVRDAAERYEERFGIRPNFCYLNPAQAANIQVPGLVLTGEASLGRNYLLIGYDGEQEEAVPPEPVARPEHDMVALRQPAAQRERRRPAASARVGRAQRASA
jgi:hypothetical protein